MVLLHGVWQLDEVGVRMRFLTAHQLERSFVGFFPHIAVLPFGSSVNGFGKRGCDLDLVLKLEKEPLVRNDTQTLFLASLYSKKLHQALQHCTCVFFLLGKIIEPICISQ